MFAKILIVLVILGIIGYIMAPKIQRQLDGYWVKCKRWINENEHNSHLEGFIEEELDISARMYTNHDYHSSFDRYINVYINV